MNNLQLYNNMMEFIDRQEEMGRLHRLLQERQGNLAVIYGRRRIGKSCLLTKWCQETDGIYWVADTSAPALQRLAFSEAISVKFPGFSDAIYPTWRALLQALSQRAYLEKWHGPVIFDEFPYIVSADATFPSVFQAWIDAEARQLGLLAVISGSSQHMMQGLALHSDSPLYGRAREILPIKPLAAGYIRGALHLANDLQAIKAYAVWGGIPRYWQSAERYDNHLEESLDDLVFNPLGLYHEEPNFLLQAETPSAIGLRPILDAIGYGSHRLSEVAARLQLPATTLSRPITRLIELRLVQRQIPFGENEKISKKSLYFIDDPFCHLWFHVIAPRRSFFASSSAKGRLLLWQQHANTIFADQWERLSRSLVHRVQRLQRLLPESDCWMPAKRWWQGNHAEWNVVTTNLSGDISLLGEVKWSETPFSEDEIKELVVMLLHRERPATIKGRIMFTLIVPSIMEPSMMPTINGVEVLTAQDILAASLAEE